MVDTVGEDSDKLTPEYVEELAVCIYIWIVTKLLFYQVHQSGACKVGWWNDCLVITLLGIAGMIV
jgi:hypothetical protein